MDWKKQVNSIFRWINAGREDTESYQIAMAYTTHSGKVRSGNEDNFFIDGTYMPLEHQSMPDVRTVTISSRLKPAVAVFDGMGGESAGELASYTAAKRFSELKVPEIWSAEYLSGVIIGLNEEVCRKRREQRFSRIGSTALIAAFNDSEMLLGNLGDSLAYLYRKCELHRISQPHTNEAFLREQGITNKKPGLTQFLGIDQEEFMVEPFINPISLCHGDLYLLCSDGLTDMVSEEGIQKILSGFIPVERKVERLRDTALENGGRDNITIILCEIQKENER